MRHLARHPLGFLIQFVEKSTDGWFSLYVPLSRPRESQVGPVIVGFSPMKFKFPLSSPYLRRIFHQSSARLDLNTISTDDVDVDSHLTRQKRYRKVVIISPIHGCPSRGGIPLHHIAISTSRCRGCFWIIASASVRQTHRTDNADRQSLHRSLQDGIRINLECCSMVGGSLERT